MEVYLGYHNNMVIVRGETLYNIYKLFDAFYKLYFSLSDYTMINKQRMRLKVRRLIQVIQQWRVC